MDGLSAASTAERHATLLATMQSVALDDSSVTAVDDTGILRTMPLKAIERLGQTLAKATHVVSLKLVGIDDQTAIVLFRTLWGNSALRKLHLERCSIGSAGQRALVQLVYNRPPVASLSVWLSDNRGPNRSPSVQMMTRCLGDKRRARDTPWLFRLRLDQGEKRLMIYICRFL